MSNYNKDIEMARELFQFQKVRLWECERQEELN